MCLHRLLGDCQSSSRLGLQTSASAAISTQDLQYKRNHSEVLIRGTHRSVMPANIAGTANDFGQYGDKCENKHTQISPSIRSQWPRRTHINVTLLWIMPSATVLHCEPAELICARSAARMISSSILDTRPQTRLHVKFISPASLPRNVWETKDLDLASGVELHATGEACHANERVWYMCTCGVSAIWAPQRNGDPIPKSLEIWGPQGSINL